MSKRIEVKKNQGSRIRQRGQGMTEYIIITALIAIAGIVVFAGFGDVVRGQTAAMATELSGQSGAAGTAAATAGAARANTGSGAANLSDYTGRQ